MLYTAVTQPTGETDYPVRYGECVSGCSDPASWHFATVGDHGVLGGYARLQLDPNGHPRVLYDYAGAVGNDAFVYATCNSGCTNAGSWSVSTVVNGDGDTGVVMANSEYFALDPSGNPAFFYFTYNGTEYASCSGNCSLPASWTSVNIAPNSTVWVDFSLAFGPDGNPQAWVSQGAPNAAGCTSGTVLGYLSCSGSCNSSAANWTILPLYCTQGETGNFRLRVSPSGGPRAVFYDDYGATPSYLNYAWCDSSCNSTTSWTSVGLGSSRRPTASAASICTRSLEPPRRWSWPSM